MFKRVAPYIGKYKKYTVWAVIMMSIGIIANVTPYFFMYQIIVPLIRGEHIDASFILIRVAAIAVCEIIFSVSYVQGLTFSHMLTTSFAEAVFQTVVHGLERNEALHYASTLQDFYKPAWKELLGI